MAFSNLVEFLDVLLVKSFDIIDYVLRTSTPYCKDCSESVIIFEFM